ncbi:sugar transferase [Psychroflexus sp. ALD_RP9]|uniref:sugar transferase n=1 Tax=Psychroflexus sp. ALD_RP9 TaxID=2777186 RepID=UPI001A9087D2|nr:sugar transferase [Psychroflexus sp. ALD_RP9]QSS98020.1 sugar transferase [Psychroflexus sp. ALD_RP9]
MYKFLFKRVLDLIVSICLIIIFLPVFIFVTIILFIQNNGKPFFFQERPGKNQKSFTIIKFKSMTDERDAQGNLLPDVERITKFGGLVRKLSIDELPQLINVLKGDMSLVGPRPLLFKYIPLYNQEQLKRHEVKPGITGWAQVNGRNSISWSKKFELDIEYVVNVSFFFDVRILLLTLKKVLVREGVNQSVTRPMQPFNGKN